MSCIQYTRELSLGDGEYDNQHIIWAVETLLVAGIGIGFKSEKYVV